MAAEQRRSRERCAVRQPGEVEERDRLEKNVVDQTLRVSPDTVTHSIANNGFIRSTGSEGPWT